MAFQHEGIETETAEAAPFWCEAHKLPYDKMWADDILWVPRILGGEYIKARFIFHDDNMLDRQVECFKRWET